MHGVSEVIAIILILMITISLAGLAYMFMSTTMSDVTSSAGSTVDMTTSSMLTSFRIESADANYIYVRNTGQNPLTSLSVYVNNLQATSITGPIAPGVVSSISLGQVAMKGDSIKVTSSDGFSTEKTLTADCYGAVGYWKMDENGGTIAYDSSPNGNSGNLTNGPIWTSGKFGNALSFDGSNDYINAGNSSIFNPSTGMTISVWVYPKGFLGANRRIVDKGYLRQYLLYFNNEEPTSNPVFAANISNNMRSIASPYECPKDSWSFIVGTYDGDKLRIYVNGTLQGTSASYPGTLDTSTVNLGIGSNYYGTENFNGTIDEVAIWNRSLSATEVAKLYSKAVY